MAASGDLTNAANVKEYLGLSGSDDDTFIGNLIDRASEGIENYCRRKFTSTQHTEYYDGRGEPRLVLNQRPIISVTSVHDDLDRAFGGGALIDSSDYITRDDEGVIEYLSSASTFPGTGACFYDGQLNVKVVYTAGYATIPTDVEQACIMLCALLYTRGKQQADGITSESHGGAYSVTYAGMAMTGEIKELLAPYREVKV